MLRGARLGFVVGRTRCRCDARGERAEDRLETGDRLVRPADHQAVATLEPEHSARRSHVEQVDAKLLEALRSRNVVAVVAVSTVDDDVARLKMRSHVVDDRADRGRGHHDPQGTWRLQRSRQVFVRRDALGTVLDERPQTLFAPCIDDAVVAVAHEAPNHVASHATEADHCELHRRPPCLRHPPRTIRATSVATRAGQTATAGSPASARATSSSEYSWSSSFPAK